MTARKTLIPFHRDGVTTAGDDWAVLVERVRRKNQKAVITIRVGECDWSAEFTMDDAIALQNTFAEAVGELRRVTHEP